MPLQESMLSNFYAYRHKKLHTMRSRTKYRDIVKAGHRDMNGINQIIINKGSDTISSRQFQIRESIEAMSIPFV
jgi:hypothetical protein